MSPLQRQVLLRYLAAFAAALVVLTSAVVAFDGVKILIEKGLTPRLVVAVVPFLLPAVARTAVQGAVLFAACFVYGRMAAKNELLALNASGISVAGVVWPALLAATALSLACVGLEDVAATWGANGIRRVVSEGLVEIAYAQLKTEKSFRAADFELTVRDVDDRRLIGPLIRKLSPDPRQNFQVQAAGGRLVLDDRRNQLVVAVRDGTISAHDRVSISFADEFRHAIPIAAEEPSSAESWDRICAQERRIEQLAAVAAKVERLRRRVRNPDVAMLIPTSDASDTTIPASFLAAPSAEAIRVSHHDATSEPEPPTLDELLARERSELNWRRALWHQKWANSFCCLAFTLVGIPIAVQFRRADYLSSFMVCFLPVLGVYQPLQFIGMAYSTRGIISPAWLHANNAMFATFGAICLLRLIRRR